MIPEEAWKLIPGDYHPDLPMWIENFAKAAEFNDKEIRAYAWAMYLLSRLTGQAISTAIMGIVANTQPWSVPEIQDISAGFIPFHKKQQNTLLSHRAARMRFSEHSVDVGGINYSFGIVLGISITEVDKISGSEKTADITPSQTVDIDGFPVVVELRQIVNNSPPHLSGAASACYVQPRRSKRFFGPIWSNGILIARHVLAPLGYSVGMSVPMVSGASLPVVDIDTSASTIDAAILDCGSIPVQATFLPLSPAIAPGSVVDVRTPAQTFSAQVLRINDHPSYFGNMVAHRVFLDTIGTSGDSGSLVLRTNPKDATGLYMGSTGGFPSEGLVQSMRQVVQYFDVDLYD